MCCIPFVAAGGFFSVQRNDDGSDSRKEKIIHTDCAIP